MSNGFELSDSRLAWVEMHDGVARLRFPHGLIHRASGRPGRSAGGLWSQEVELVLDEVQALAPLPVTAGTVAEGYLEVGGVRHEILPLPFSRRADATLWLRLVEGGELSLCGRAPVVELLGRARFLDSEW